MIKRILKAMKSAMSSYLLAVCSESRFLSSLYYVFFPRAFGFEHRGVIAGRLSHAKAKAALDGSYILRRNIHRLEKGLTSPQRKTVFAREYIEETIRLCETLAAGRSESGSDITELQWARDVLEEYFQQVGKDPIIGRARTAFGKIKFPFSDVKRVPYRRDLTRIPSVSFEQFMDLSRRRRSVRWYLSKPVSRDLIDRAIEAAAQAPSACNRQPFEFRIYDDGEIISKIVDIPVGMRGFGSHFPAIAIIVGKLRAYSSEQDRHIIYIDGSLAAMAFIYSLEILGLSSCCINWPENESAEIRIRQLLHLEADERVILLISIGYPDPEGQVAYSQKKPLDRIRSYNR